MLSRGMRTRGISLSEPSSRPPPSSFVPIQTTIPLHSHTSIFRSLQLDLHIHSPSVKVVHSNSQAQQRALPVFGERDQVQGTVKLDPSCSQTGRIIVSIEGAFVYPSQLSQSSDSAQKHIFYTASTSFAVGSSSENLPRSAFRDAFHATLRRRISGSSLDEKAKAQSERSYSFNFNLPRSSRRGEELPPSFSPPPDKRHELYEVTYLVTSTWYSAEENPSVVQAPILLHPDSDFQSFDGSLDASTSDAWLEMPLKSDRQIPFRCAITLPSPVSFKRTSSIPFFVVFTTTPRSPSLRREIASDASISVSLVRQITVSESPALPPTPPTSPSISSEDSEIMRQPRRLRRVHSGSLSILSRASRNLDDSISSSRMKELPRLPTQVVFNQSTVLRNSVCIGFPKRPRQRCEPDSHPSLESHNALPDGLHKSKISLTKDMLGSIDWAGLVVKYYINVSVLVGQDELRARIPIQILP